MSSVRRVPLVLVALVVLATCCAGSALAGPARTHGAAATPVKGIATVDALFAGIPQHGAVLGNPGAKVTLFEFGDLRCPVCQRYETAAFPDFVRTWVRTGKVKVSFQLWPILGPDSVVAARAGFAAQKQNRFWQFAELFYLNQGSESVHYVNATYLDRLATSAKLDTSRFERERQALYKAPLADIASTANYARFQGTPSFGVIGPKNGFAIGFTAATATAFRSSYTLALRS
jgi:protein-disulfide isomerase